MRGMAINERKTLSRCYENEDQMQIVEVSVWFDITNTPKQKKEEVEKITEQYLDQITKLLAN